MSIDIFRSLPQEEVDLLGQALKDKAVSNSRRGFANIQSGEVKVFRGHPVKSYEGSQDFLLIYDDESAQVLDLRVVSPLLEIFKESGIKVVGPNHWDKAPHLNLQPAPYPSGLSIEEIAQKTAVLAADPALGTIEQQLKGTIYPMNRLVVSGRDFYICVTDPQALAPIVNARREVQKVYLSDENGPKPQDYSNIAHTTVLRIVKLPDSEENPIKLAEITRRVYREIHLSLVKDPLVMRVGEVYRGLASRFDESAQYLRLPE